MKLPKRVQVLDLTYCVGVKEELDLDGHPAEGITDYAAGEIWVRSDQAANPTRARGTLVHELIHAILDATGADDYLRRGKEEDFVQAFAPALITTLESAGLLKRIKG